MLLSLLFPRAPKISGGMGASQPGSGRDHPWRTRIAVALALLGGVGGLGAAWLNRGTTIPQKAPVIREARYAMTPFGDVAVYAPDDQPRATVLLLSGDQGWNGGMERIARALAARDILVAGVSTPTFMRNMERSSAYCINPNYPLMALAGDVQHRMAVRSYMKPIIMGYSSGATIAYASLAQWPNGSYRGVFSLGFSPDTPGRKPWCHEPGFATHRSGLDQKDWIFAPNPKIKLPWFVIQGGADRVVDFGAARAFAAKVPRAVFLPQPTLTHDFSDHLSWFASLDAALEPMLAPEPGISADAALQDLPINVVPNKVVAGAPADVMAVIYSGDGGWVGIDRDVAGQIASQGIPVVGIDSLSYFWSARTPAGAAHDLARMIRFYGEKWKRPRIMLVGYSFGANALPAIISSLDPATRTQIKSLALLGLGPTSDFQFHVGSWLDMASAQAKPTVPAVEQLKGLDIICIRGAEESDSACPQIPSAIASMITVPGGHHFDRNASLLARLILRTSSSPIAKR